MHLLFAQTPHGQGKGEIEKWDGIIIGVCLDFPF